MVVGLSGTMEQELIQLELLCCQLYESTDAQQRTKAEEALVAFTASPDCLTKCHLLLDRSESSYSQLLAATTLTKLVSRTPCTLTIQERIDIKNYVLRYLAANPKQAPYVTQALVLLYARITKLGWFDCDKDEYVFREIITQIKQFLTGSTDHCLIGVHIFSQLTCEMNQMSCSDASRSITKQRRIASSFRDSHLYEIFTLAFDFLRQGYESWKGNANFHDETQQNLMSQLLRLTLNCLSFDFIGTTPDESTDDISTVQIPTNWRPAFLDMATLQLFFDLFHVLPPSLAPLSLSCLVQIASVRRSLFNNAERAKFLQNLVNGVRHILENPSGLTDTNSYHEFCRLLARLKSNYQLSELVKVDGYPEVIALVTKFTVTSLQMWQFAPNSIHYLLSLWQRMVASVPYVKATEPHLLETYTPEVTKAYITSRVDSVPIILRDGLDDPFDDIGMVNQQLEQLSTIVRCEYDKTCALIVELFDQSAALYEQLLRSAPANSPEITIQERKLTWLVYIIGASIGGRVFLNSTEDHDAMDGQMAIRVLRLMNLTDTRLAAGGSCEKLELALLSFFEYFRKIYVGDQVQKTSKLYRLLSEVLGLSEETMILSVFVRKIMTNLKYWSNSELIINKTLQILTELSSGYSSVRKIVKLDEVQFILSNHTAEHFPFLGNTLQIGDMRCRSTFYTSLGRLLMIDLGEDDDKFDQFVAPLTAQFEILKTAFLSQDPAIYNADEAKKALIGLARDLRGLACAFNTKMSFMMLFEWVYPNYMPVLHRAIELWYTEPQITTPVLKLMAELVQNRSQRLQFDVSSPNGILLFRETSKMMITYGSRILSMGGDIPKDKMYSHKLKGISICFSMLKSALCGGYVNFGVFRLYGDSALDDALGMFVRLLLSIPQQDLLNYPKLSQTYYVLLECLAQDHMNFLAGLDPPVFLHILSSISEGLTAIDTMVCTGCCATLDHIVSYLFKWVSKSSKHKSQAAQRNGLGHGQNATDEPCLKVLEMHPELLQQMLQTILNIIMFEECKNQWSMSRPLLGLILLNEEYFRTLRANIISSQPLEKQATMAQWFDGLMEGIERNLLTKNRDRFTQNLSVFRRDINDSLKGPLNNANNASGGGGGGVGGGPGGNLGPGDMMS